MDLERAIKAASLLEAVSDQTMTSAAALKEWPGRGVETDELISAGWHELAHYENDADLGKTDPDGKAGARKRIKNWATLIRMKHGVSRSGE
jgi:hypothetical protein